jgi:hypothetical protein
VDNSDHRVPLVREAEIHKLRLFGDSLPDVALPQWRFRKFIKGAFSTDGFNSR